LVAVSFCLAQGVEADPEANLGQAPVPDTLTGNWTSRVKATERGVAPFAVLTTEFWGNVAGGIEQRGWWNSLLDFGLELDTTKLGWWEGGSFLVQAHWAQNSSSTVAFQDFTGAFNPVSGIVAGDHLRIFNLYYRHQWRDERAVLKIGQLAVDDDFMGSDYGSLFLNSAFGAMPSQVGTPLATSAGNPPAFPIYSVAAPGLFLRVRPAPSFYSQLGLYYGWAGFDNRSNYGFDWADQAPPELGLFWESGVQFQIARREATSRLGLSYHTGPVDDFGGCNTGEPRPAVRPFRISISFRTLP
jgi:porin